MRLILLGPPGAGKGTQAVRMAYRFGVPHVATGDLLRFATAWQTDIGMRAKTYMDAGELVPDEFVLELLCTRLSEDDAAVGFVLDGYPRNPAQADALDAILAEIDAPLEAAVNLWVPDENIIARLSARMSCPTCGRTFNSTAEAPLAVCDIDGMALFQRADDSAEVIAKRLQVFRDRTAPLIEYYGARDILVTVDGIGELGDVEDRIAKALEER